MKFDYANAQKYRNQSNVGFIKREIERISGRFILVDTINDGKKVVGFCGNAFGDDLSTIQLHHICGFYGMTGDNIDVEVVREYPNAKPYLRGMNDYIIITKEEV